MLSSVLQKLSFFFAGTDDDSRLRGKSSMQKIAIVGREHCYETTRELPIGKQSEAIEAAKHMGDIAPFAGKLFFIVESLSQDKSRVYFCVVREEIYAELSQESWFVFPESLLIRQYLFSEQKEQSVNWLLTMPNRALRVVADKSAFITSIQSMDSQSTDLSLYLNYEAPQQLSEAEYWQCLLRGMSKSPRYFLAQAFNSKRAGRNLSQIPWKFAGYAAASLGIIYLACSSLYLTWMQKNIDEQLKSQQAELTKVFDLQSDIDQIQASLLDLQSNEHFSKTMSQVWHPIFKLLQNKDVNIRSFSYENGSFLLSAQAERAIDVLDRMTKMDAIQGTEMAAPVVASRGKETVSIRFKLKEQTAQQGDRNASK